MFMRTVVVQAPRPAALDAAGFPAGSAPLALEPWMQSSADPLARWAANAAAEQQARLPPLPAHLRSQPAAPHSAAALAAGSFGGGMQPAAAAAMRPAYAPPPPAHAHGHHHNPFAGAGGYAAAAAAAMHSGWPGSNQWQLEAALGMAAAQGLMGGMPGGGGPPPGAPRGPAAFNPAAAAAMYGAYGAGGGDDALAALARGLKRPASMDAAALGAMSAYGFDPAALAAAMGAAAAAGSGGGGGGAKRQRRAGVAGGPQPSVCEEELDAAATLAMLGDS